MKWHCSSRHKIRNLNPCGLRPSSLLLGHGDSPQYWIFTSEQGRNTSFLWNLNARANPRSPISQTASFNHYNRTPAQTKKKTKGQIHVNQFDINNISWCNMCNYYCIFIRLCIKPYNAEIIMCKPWRPTFFVYEIIINVLVSPFRFIWIPMLCFYGHNEYFTLSVPGLTLDVRVWRLWTLDSEV